MIRHSLQIPWILKPLFACTVDLWKAKRGFMVLGASLGVAACAILADIPSVSLSIACFFVASLGTMMIDSCCEGKNSRSMKNEVHVN